MELEDTVDVTETLGLVAYFVVVSAITMAMGVRRRAPHASEPAAEWERGPWDAPPSIFIGDIEQTRASFACSYDAGFEGSECYRTVPTAHSESGWRFRDDSIREKPRGFAEQVEKGARDLVSKRELDARQVVGLLPPERLTEEHMGLTPRDQIPAPDWGSCVSESKRSNERVERRNRILPPKLTQLRTVY